MFSLNKDQRVKDRCEILVKNCNSYQRVGKKGVKYNVTKLNKLTLNKKLQEK